MVPDMGKWKRSQVNSTILYSVMMLVLVMFHFVCVCELVHAVLACQLVVFR